MLRCRDVFALLGDLLDGTLESAVTRALEAHLLGCEDCTAFLATYRGTVRATRSIRERELPAQLRERLLAVLAERRPR